MLSIKEIINILEPNQINIEKNDTNKIDNNEYIKIGNKDLYFHILKYDLKINNNFIKFLSAILNVFDSTFLLTEKRYKIEKIETFINKMITDYDNKNFYYKFYYNKNKKIRKSLIQTLLYDILNKKKVENINILQQFISDYFSINIIILTNEITPIKLNENLYYYDFINTNQYNNTINKYVPTIILFKEEEEYYPILNIDKNYLLYSENKDILKYMYINCFIFIEEYKYIKKSISELRDICLEMNMNIKKKSSSSGKNIYMKKTELLENIRLNYDF